MLAMTRKFHAVLILTAMAPAFISLGGCASAVIGAGATAGVAAYDERGIKGVASDTVTSTKIKAKLFEKDEILFRDVGVEVYEYRVLLTGVVGKEEMRADAVKLAWSFQEVKDVINEIQVGSSGIIDYARDAWISTQLKTKMTLDKTVLAINYSIETVNGVIYLIGIAQNQGEIDRVIAHARSIDYVKRVVSHLRIKRAAE